MCAHNTSKSGKKTIHLIYDQFKDEVEQSDAVVVFSRDMSIDA